MSFKVGDRVQLKSGGEIMTIEEIDDDSAAYICFDNKKYWKTHFVINNTKNYWVVYLMIRYTLFC